MATKHWVQVAAMVVIGEGVVGLLQPEKYVRFWEVGPRPLRELVGAMADHPTALRLVFAAQLAAGYWIARKQLEE